jgi:hypothetical protein
MLSIQVKEFDSESGLQGYLQQRSSNVILGQDAESPRKFYAVVPDDGSVPIVGIISSGHGTKPSLVELPSGERILLGHDCKLTTLDRKTNEVVFVLPLNGVFFDFVTGGEGSLAAVHELGAVGIDEYGKLRWQVDTDVVEDFKVDSRGELTLHAMDGTVKVVDVRSGRVKSTH